jgi:signal transduction histidine kinase
MLPQLKTDELPLRDILKVDSPDFGGNSSKLLSTICHDLRSPLAVIRGYTSLLLEYDGDLENAEKLEYIESIDKATGRLAERVDSILDVSCLESGILHLGKTLVDVSEFAREAVSETRLRALEYKIQTACHELRAPLAIIRGYASLLLEYNGDLGHEEKLEYVELIDKATSRLVELVDDMLDMSRLESGMLHLEKTLADISELAREAVSEALLRAPEYRIQLIVEEDLPCIQIDSRRIRQVLDNILDNAMEYSEEGTDITVKITPRENELLVSISDRGISIPSGDLEKVFQPMFRLGRQLPPDNRGIGLGLTICLGIIKAHGGRIWLDNNEGKGSTARFTLPF